MVISCDLYLLFNMVGVCVVGSESRDALASVGLGPPVSDVSSSSPVRPLLLRADVSWTPEESARGSGGSCTSVSAEGVSAISSGCVPSWDSVGGRILRDYETYMSGLRDGVAGVVVGSPLGLSGGRTPRERDAYRAGVQVGVAGAAEVRSTSVSGVDGSAISPGARLPRGTSQVYELPPGVVERLAFGEALHAAHRRGRGKRRREDGNATLDDVAGEGESDPAPPCDDEPSGGDEGATGGGSMST